MNHIESSLPCQSALTSVSAPTVGIEVRATHRARELPPKALLRDIGRRTWWTTVLAGSLGLALASPRAHAIAPSEAVAPARASQAPPGVLRVQVAPAIDDASLIPGWIATRNPQLIEQVPEVDGHTQWIAVTVAGATYDYQLTVTPMRDGKPITETEAPVRCACSSEELLELIDTRIATAVEQLRVTPVEGPEPKSLPVEATPPSEVKPAVIPEYKKLSGVGIGGIVVASLGAAGLGAGIAMLVVAPQSVSGLTSLEGNWQPPGLPTLVAGGSAFAAGLTMLVVDAVQCRRRPDPPRRCERRSRSSHEPALGLGPSVRANGGGVTVSGRF